MDRNRKNLACLVVILTLVMLSTFLLNAIKPGVKPVLSGDLRSEITYYKTIAPDFNDKSICEIFDGTGLELIEFYHGIGVRSKKRLSKDEWLEHGEKFKIIIERRSNDIYRDLD